MAFLALCLVDGWEGVKGQFGEPLDKPLPTKAGVYTQWPWNPLSMTQSKTWVS